MHAVEGGVLARFGAICGIAATVLPVLGYIIHKIGDILVMAY